MAAKQYLEQLVGVFGYPVAENPTVVLQQAAFKALQLPWRYLTIEVLPKDLERALSGLRAFNMRGINLTIPHKQTVLAYLDELSPAAELIGAVNTVVNRDGKLYGENTDGKGFLRSLTEDAKTDAAGRHILILGAGGAARAIAVELALAGAGQITIVNRSAERGEQLSRHITEQIKVPSRFIPWEGTIQIPGDAEIIVNATSIGLPPEEDQQPDINTAAIHSGMIVCDVIPAPSTPFLKEAAARGAYTLDGLGMLVYQGAIGFTLWTGEDAPVEIMHRALLDEFQADECDEG